ncbi:MAG: Gfo/Idh/MocA family oxidoreductase, partial [Bacteroidota bacterium]
MQRKHDPESLTMNQEKIKFGIIGFGHIGKKHAAMVDGNADSELVAVVDPDPAKRQEAVDLYGVPAYEAFEGLFENAVAPDVVNVCTPNGMHADQAKAVLDNRCHVVIEKPMGLSKRNCEDVIFKALQVSKHAFIVKQNRY